MYVEYTSGKREDASVSEHKRAMQQLDKRNALAVHMADHMDNQILWEESTIKLTGIEDQGVHLDKTNGQRSEHRLRSLTQHNLEHDAVKTNQQGRDRVPE